MSHNQPCMAIRGTMSAASSSQWKLVQSERVIHPLASVNAVMEAWHYTFAKDSQSIVFRVCAWTKPYEKDKPPRTVACRFTHFEHGVSIFGEGVSSVEVMGEACCAMVRDRLLCGLRDGSVRGTVEPRFRARQMPYHRITSDNERSRHQRHRMMKPCPFCDERGIDIDCFKRQ